MKRTHHILGMSRFLFAMGVVAFAGCGAENSDASLSARIEKADSSLAARVDSVVVKASPGAAEVRREQTSLFFRDADGRTRLERDGKVYLGARGEKRRVVLDPVAHTATELRPLSPLSGPSENPIAAKEPVALATIADEDLGRRVVAGATAVGRRKVFAVPAGVVGKSPAYEIEREQWTTSGRDIPVQTVVRNGGNHTTTTVTITPLDRDVRSSMFEIPEGYARR